MDKSKLELLEEVPFQIKSDEGEKTTVVPNSRLCAGMIRTWRRYHLDVYKQVPVIELFDKDGESMGLLTKFDQGQYGQSLIAGSVPVKWDVVVSFTIDTAIVQQFVKFMNMFCPVYVRHNTPGMLRVVTVRGMASALLLTRGKRNIGVYSRSFCCDTKDGVHFGTTVPSRGRDIEMMCFKTSYDACWEEARHKAIRAVDQLHHGFAA